ncbi:MAG TPA: hypothetical protein VJ438_04070 [Candidatus Nanoarchaeia archaeon]|nr:hypothetical protein [Candidatus Nanoarchaeia archaeon]
MKSQETDKSDSIGTRPVQSKRRYIFSLLIGTGIFILIFLLANFISYLEFQRITTLQGKTAYGIFESKLNYDFFNEMCSQEALEDISQQLGFQGAVIDDLEKKLGKKNSEVLFQKKFYTLVELEHLNFITDYNKKCNSSFNTIMFFYSNNPLYYKDNDKLGRLLDAIYSKYPEKVIIYSFDVDLDSELISKLKQKYDIEKVPTVIMNQKVTLFNPQNIQEIEIHLN